MTRPHPQVMRRIMLARNIGRQAHTLAGAAQQYKEVALLVAAYCYTYRPAIFIMNDEQYDTLAKHIANSPDISPYLRECCDIELLGRTGSSISIDFSHGVAQLTAEMFTTGWTPSKQTLLNDARLVPTNQRILRGLSNAPRRK